MPKTRFRWLLSGLTLVTLVVLSTLSIQVSLAQDYGSNWVASYYNNTDFSGSPVATQGVSQINFNFGTGSPLAGFVNTDNFSIRFTGLQNFAAQGTYRFFANANDGARVTIDGVEVINFLSNRGSLQLRTADVVVAAGSRQIVVEFVEADADAAIQFYWQSVSVLPTNTAGPSPTPTVTGLPPIPAGAQTATVIQAGVLNIRSAPALGAPKLGEILRGQTYQVLGRDENAEWFLLQLSGYQGWAFGYYLFVSGNEFNPPIVSSSSAYAFPPGVVDTGVLVQVRAGMKMRTAPNLNAQQNGRIPWGSFLPVVGRNSGGDWYQVVWKGTVGWVFNGYTRLYAGDLSVVPVVAGT